MNNQKFSQRILGIDISFRWQIVKNENGVITWKLYKDIDPRGGHEIWTEVHTEPKYRQEVPNCEPEVPQCEEGEIYNPDSQECELEEPVDPCSEEPDYNTYKLLSITSDEKPQEPVCPTPEPSEPPIGGPEATPSPAPDDGKSGHRSSLGNDNLQCTNTHFDAVMDVKWDGVGQKDVKVVFYFNGERIETRSNENGRARTQYPIGSGVLIAEAEGYPTQSQVIAAPACEPVVLDPDGSVLGATTLASTGSQDLFAAAGVIGSGLSLLGSAAYGYFRQKQNA